MQIVLITDFFHPHRTSGAIQMRDLSLAFVRHGIEVTVLVPEATLGKRFQIDMWCGIRIVRLKARQTKDIGYLFRTVNECLMPLIMYRQLKKSPLHHVCWDAVVWYSPSIFFGPLVTRLKKKSGCKGYLILRDMFPEWALDLGLLRRGLPYLFFKTMAQYQYAVADVIGVQSAGNLRYLKDWARKAGRNMHVLPNWLADVRVQSCSIDIDKTTLAGRKIFVYAGNMGVAQGMDALLTLADQLKQRQDIGFVFVGRGSEAGRLQRAFEAKALDNALFFDEIDPSEIPGLYAQCHVGLIALDLRHQTHNIPGKFLSYMQSGLPVLAHINVNNDLVGLIQVERVGKVASDVKMLRCFAESLLEETASDQAMSERCQSLAKRLFSPESTVRQIVKALNLGTVDM